MDLNLKNRVALIAASSKGIGKAIAWAFAREGTKLVICSRNKEVLEKTADDIFLGTGVSVFPLAVDLSDNDRIQWMVAETLDLFGRIDILVTNAGGPPPGHFMDFSENEWMQSIQLTTMSVVRLCRAAIPSMQKNHWGRIINLTSVSVKQPIDGLLLSNVLRPGIIGLTKTLSQELASDNILVNAVCPGYILTDRVQQLLASQAEETKKDIDQLMKERIAQIPLGRIGDPAELANLVIFLASECASYITGTTIPVDGGFIKGIM